MRGKLPYNKTGAGIEDIIQKLPKKPYMAVFGTSHSSGCCEKNGYALLDHNDIWCNVLAKRRELEVVNFSIPGNDNSQMLNQLTQFLDLPGQYRQNCKLIIAESRVGAFQGKFPKDLFTDHKNPIERGGLQLGGGYDFRYQTIENELYIHYAIGKVQKDYYKKILEDSIHPDWQPQDISPAMLNMLKDIVRIHELTRVSSEVNFYEDYANINTMRVLSKIGNVPFYWFCWDEKGKNINTDYVTKFYERHTDLFEAQILYPNLKRVIRTEVGKQFELENQCDCYHNNEVIHAWVADRIDNELENKNNDR